MIFKILSLFMRIKFIFEAKLILVVLEPLFQNGRHLNFDQVIVQKWGKAVWNGSNK